MANRLLKGRPSKMELQKLYLDQKLGSLMISRKYGVSDTTVINWLRQYDIQIRSPHYMKHGIPLKRNLLQDRKDGLTLAGMSEKYTVSVSTVSRWVKHYDLPPAHSGRYIPPPSKKTLEGLYLEQKFRCKEIAWKFGVCSQTAWAWLMRYDIPLRPPHHRRKEPPSKEILTDLYINQRLSGYEIAIKYGVAGSTVYRWLDYFNIRIFKKSELHDQLSAGKRHYREILKEAEEFERQGFRCIPLGDVIPDFIAMKDGKVFAVEVEYKTPNYDKYTDEIRKSFDDIIWIIKHKKA